jgi:filamin
MQCVNFEGLCPDWEDWNPANCQTNAKEAMEAAEQWLDVPQVNVFN